jgi:hypothetical protein
MRATVIVTLCATATALAPSRHAATPRAILSEAARSAAAAALALPLLVSPAYAGVAPDDTGVEATASFLAEASKSKFQKVERDTTSPFGLEAGVKTPFEKGAAKEVAAEVKAAESLAAKKANLVADIKESEKAAIGDKAPAVEFKAPTQKKETPAWVKYEPPPAPVVEVVAAPEPAEPAFTITSKREDPNVAATNEWFKEAAKSKAKPTPKKAPVVEAKEDPFAALSSKVEARY